jgi:hypothetical protein
MFLRSIVLTLCVALVCLGAVAGCAPPSSTAQPPANYAAFSPAVTAAPADVPALDEQAPPNTTTPSTDVPEYSL